MTVRRHSTQTLGSTDAPPCPRCGRPMGLRWGRNGKFYGCTDYPICRGVMSMAAVERARRRAEPFVQMTEEQGKALGAFRKLCPQREQQPWGRMWLVERVEMPRSFRFAALDDETARSVAKECKAATTAEVMAWARTEGAARVTRRAGASAD